MPSPRAIFATARRKRPALDHLVRAVSRYGADSGDRLAAAVTFYWFLSLFPILLLAISVLGYIYGDDANAKVQDALGGVLPSQLVDTIGSTLTDAKGPAGVIGILGTLVSGLGWIDGLRDAIRTLWHQNVKAGNFLVKKLVDTLALVGLFATIGASLVVTGLATQASATVLDLVNVADTGPARAFTRLLALALSLLADTALFAFLFAGLARVRTPVRRVLQGALFGAVGFEILKVLGAYYVARTTSKGAATYGTFAVVVGLLLFLNLFSRLLLFTAAWTVTGPYDSDIAPSGTASPDMADKAGIPREFADNSPDDPPTLTEEGAPSPLAAAIQGQTPPQDEPTGRPAVAASGGSAAGRRQGGRPANPGRRAAARSGRPAGPQPSAGEAAVTRAARVVTGAGAVVIAGVGVYTVRALRDLIRS